MLDELMKLRVVNKLKDIDRFSFIGKRKESSAEHSWSCLIIADYFIEKIEQPIDKLKVYELLAYHDMVEIEAGDTPLHPGGKDPKAQKEKEAKAARILEEKLPEPIKTKFSKSFHEFEEAKTIEARFAKAIDAFDVMIQQLKHKPQWKGWTETLLIKSKEPLFKKFPSIMKEFNELLSYLKKEGYLNQR